MDFLKKAAYILVAIVVSYVVVLSAGPWVSLAVILSFIFGPKLYRGM